MGPSERASGRANRANHHDWRSTDSEWNRGYSRPAGRPAGQPTSSLSAMHKRKRSNDRPRSGPKQARKTNFTHNTIHWDPFAFGLRFCSSFRIRLSWRVFPLLRLIRAPFPTRAGPRKDRMIKRSVSQPAPPISSVARSSNGWNERLCCIPMYVLRHFRPGTRERTIYQGAAIRSLTRLLDRRTNDLRTLRPSFFPRFTISARPLPFPTFPIFFLRPTDRPTEPTSITRDICRCCIGRTPGRPFPFSSNTSIRR